MTMTALTAVLLAIVAAFAAGRWLGTRDALATIQEAVQARQRALELVDDYRRHAERLQADRSMIEAGVVVWASGPEAEA